MTLVTEKPEGLPAEPNDLDNIDVPDAPPVPASIFLSGRALLVMDTPPEPGEFVKIEVTLRCREYAGRLLDGGEYSYRRIMDFISARVTTEPFTPVDNTPPPPDPEKPQPALFDHGGDVSAEASGAGGDSDPDSDEPGDGDGDGDVESVGEVNDGLDQFRPEFSDAGK